MANVYINGTEAAASGTVLIPCDVSASVDMIGSRIHFAFAGGEVGRIDVEGARDGARLVFYGMDNPMGAAARLPGFIKNPSGVYDLAVSVYAIGIGSNVTRIVHYTLFYTGPAS